MKSKKILWILILSSWLLTACQAEGRYQATLITEGEHVLSGTTYGDLLILGGETTLAQDSTLAGSAHLLAGKINIEGTIEGDLFYLNGELSLGPEGRIEGDLNLAGGQGSGVDPGVVGGAINGGSGLDLPASPREDREAGWIALRWFVSSLILGLVASILERYLPEQVKNVGDTALEHFPVALAMGILAGIVSLTLLVLMAYTIVLLPVAFLLLILLGLAVVYGWVAWGRVLARWAAQKLGLKIGPRWEAFSGTMLFFMCLNGAGAIQKLGGLIGILAAAAGLGSVYLTRFGSSRFVPINSQTKLQ